MLKELAQKAEDKLVIKYVDLDDLIDTFLIGNSKKHDIPDLIDRFQRHGFRDAIAFDVNLNDGAGGLVYGNGRLEALCVMRDDGMSPPRGITKDWKIPVSFGVDSTSEAEAIAFSIEHNWAGVGSEVDLDQMLLMFDTEPLADQLKFLDQENSLPIPAADNLDELLETLEVRETEKDDFEQADLEEQPPQEDSWTTLRCKVPDEVLEPINTAIDKISQDKTLHEDKAIAMGQVLEILVAEYLAGC